MPRILYQKVGLRFKLQTLGLIMRILVTVSSGLIGSEVVSLFANEGHQIFGVDSSMRADFFGSLGGARGTRKTCGKYTKLPMLNLMFAMGMALRNVYRVCFLSALIMLKRSRVMT